MMCYYLNVHFQGQKFNTVLPIKAQVCCGYKHEDELKGNSEG